MQDKNCTADHHTMQSSAIWYDILIACVKNNNYTLPQRFEKEKMKGFKKMPIKVTSE